MGKDQKINSSPKIKEMKIEKVRRFNKKKKGSFEVECWLFDWECSILQGGMKFYLAKKKLPKGTKTFIGKLIKDLSKALSKVLKAEMSDLKGQKSLFKD